ncbi:MAG: glycosyltransferase family 2 protein [Acidobacteria bacterium]|nr:glycosyltransferase family 2 protein [Acidobacteriota bacterium]
MKQCVCRMLEQISLIDSAEIIIVDNGSTDNTKEVALGLVREGDGKIKYIHENHPGACRARNRGRMEAKGNWLAFIDDDALPHEDWVKSILTASSLPEVDLVTGRIFAKPVGGIPEWFPNNLLWVLAEYNHGDNLVELTYPESGFPAGNFAIKTSVYDHVGGFNEELKIYGEEVLFFKMFAEGGHKAFYFPEMAIDHMPDLSRMTKRSLLTKALHMGRGVGGLRWIDQRQSHSKLIGLAFGLIVKGSSLMLVSALSQGRFDRMFTGVMNLGSALETFDRAWRSGNQKGRF